METFVGREIYVVQRTNKAEIRPEEQSKKKKTTKNGELWGEFME